MEIAKLILEYLKVLLSGPVLLFSFIVFVAFRYKGKVTDFFNAIINRLGSAEKGLIEISKFGKIEFSQSAQKEQVLDEGQILKPPEKGQALDQHRMPESELPKLGELTKEQMDKIITKLQIHIKDEKAKTDFWQSSALFWEYSYLNYFLVPGTQTVFEWINNSKNPITVGGFHVFWLELIPNENERNAILQALLRHYLIEIDKENFITVTPKGKDYRDWRAQPKAVSMPS